MWSGQVPEEHISLLNNREKPREGLFYYLVSISNESSGSGVRFS